MIRINIIFLQKDQKNGPFVKKTLAFIYYEVL